MKRRSSELEAALARLDREHLTRERRTIASFTEPGSRVGIVVAGRALTDFSSNDYLGLARHPAVAAAMSDCAQRCGAGSGASHLISGHGHEHRALEEELAAWTSRPRALLLSSGYMANLAVIGTLAGRGEQVLLDRLSHASLIDGARLCGARFTRYTHADPAAAQAAFAADSAPTAVLATDGVFSMDGDVAPLPALARVSRAQQAWLIVDDAHGLGILGATGRGSLEHFSLAAEDAPVLVGTLGKALGSFGAFIAGSADLIELLVQRARSYIYTTALPQPVAAATRQSLEIAQRESWRRERVLALAARFRSAAVQLGIPLAPSASSQSPAFPAAGPAPRAQPLTPIQPVMLGSSVAALAVQQKLLAAGFFVSAIRPPTVAAGSARLRVALSAAHTESQVDRLLESLSSACVQQRAMCE
ncbi:MAG TPA: 8-amino-7-oxononanoate synthase [Steroidobacteraceae bacterium]